MAWYHRLRNLLRLSQLDRDIDRELSFHIAERIDEFIASGMNVDEAHRAARRQFGNYALQKERTREMKIPQWLESVATDLRCAVRGIRRSPAFTLVAVLMLTLGIGASIAAFSFINGILLDALPFDEPQQLVRLNRTWPDRDMIGPGLPLAVFVDFRNRATMFEAMAAFQSGRAGLIGDGPTERVEYARATAGYFEMLGVQPLIGRSFGTEPLLPDGTSPAVISYAYWQDRWGGDSSVLGRTFQLEGLPVMTIVGVMPQTFRSASNAEMPQSVWTLSGADSPVRGNSGTYFVIGRLRSGQTVEAAQSQADAIAASLAEEYPATDGGGGVSVELLQESIVRNYRRTLLIFAAAVAFVLLIAVFNVVNLQASYASKREREMSIRAALGASRWRLIRQMVMESVLITLASGILGVLLFYALRNTLLAMIPESLLPRMDNILIDSSVLLCAVTLAFACGLFIGVASAIRASRPDLNSTLKSATSAATESRYQKWLQHTLTVVETSMATILLVGAGLLIHSFYQLTSVEIGFDPQSVVTARVALPRPYSDLARQDTLSRTLLDNLRRRPEVDAAFVSNTIPMQSEITSRVRAADTQATSRAMIQEVSSDYAATLRIPMLFGRWMSADDADQGMPVCVVSESVARSLWPGQNPIGRQVRAGTASAEALTVVGVVPDIRTSRTDEPHPVLYAPYTRHVLELGALFGRSVVFGIRHSGGSAVTPLREIIQQAEPNSVVTIELLEDIVGRGIRLQRFQTAILTVFAGIAMVLAMLGVYSVVAFAVTQRTREVGLRIALGAPPREVTGQIMRASVLAASAGLALGLVASMLFARFLQSYLFEIEPATSWAYSAVVVVGLVLVLLASWLPARRAAGINPIVALRHE